MFAGMIF